MQVNGRLNSALSEGSKIVQRGIKDDTVSVWHVYIYICIYTRIFIYTHVYSYTITYIYISSIYVYI